MNTPKTEIDSAPIPTNQIVEQMERILQSKHFSQARSLDTFLRYAVTKTLAHETDELKELLIGRAVFHRDEQYDPARDAVVRVQAGILRKKLAGYYAEEGRADEILIDLPKGGYVPTFRLRQKEVVNLPDAPSLVITGANLQPRSQAKRYVKWQIAASFLIGLLVMMAFQQWSRFTVPFDANQVGIKNSIVTPELLPVWGKFLSSEASTVLAYGTPQFFQFNGFYLRDVMVNSPQEMEAASGERLAVVRKAFKTSLDPIEVYTGVGEAHGISTLARFFWQNDREVTIARSRLVGWQEVKNSNLIFLSSMRFHTLANELGYPNDFVLRSGVMGKIINLRPAANEQSEYVGGSFAVITLWPGKAAHRYILHLGGNDTWGTMAAAEYVTSKESLRHLNAQLEQCRQKHEWQKHPAYFQVLIRAEVKDNQPISLTYITHHDFDFSEQATTQTASIR